MSYRFIRYLFLSSLLIVALQQTWAQDNPLADCKDTQPFITGPDVVRISQTFTYSSANITGHTYLWELTPGAGTITSTSNLSECTVEWLTPGTGILSLTEENSADPGCTGVRYDLDITVHPLLQAYFYYEFDPAGGCYYDRVNFHAEDLISEDPVTTYTWDFGDGETGTDITFLHPFDIITYPPPHTFEVKLTIANSSGSDEIIDYVYVDPDRFKPTANVNSITAPTPNCTYNAYTFSAVGSLPKPAFNPDPTIKIKYCEWHIYNSNNVLVGSVILGDGLTIPPPLETPFIFPAPGSYTVELVIKNTINCESTTTQTVIVGNTLPVAAFVVDIACIDFPTLFHDFSGAVVPGESITRWEWDWDDGTITVYDLNAIPPTPPPSQIEHTYLTAGGKVVKLQVTSSSDCISEITSEYITVAQSPNADFEYDAACANTSVDFRDLSTENGGGSLVSREWDFGDGGTGSGTSPSHIYNTSGTYPVTLTVTNQDGCSNITSENIFVHPIPEFTPDPNVGFTWDNAGSPLEIQFTDNTDPAVVGNNLQWNFGDGQAGFGKDPVHHYTSPGNYNVEMICTGANECTNSYVEMIFLDAPPPTFQIDPPNACMGEVVTVTPNPVVLGVILSEEWWYQDEGFSPDPLVTPPYTVRHVFIPPIPMPAIDTHSFKNYGVKAIRHIITLAGTPPTVMDFTDYVTIHDTAIANFSWNNINQPPVGGTPLPGCEDQEVFFFNKSLPPAGSPIGTYIWKWVWEFDDPASGTSNYAYTANCSHIFKDPIKTTFNVRLTVTSSDNNCETTIIKQIFIKDSPPVDFLYDTACQDNVTAFWADASITYIDSIVAWSWNFGDGTPLISDPINTNHLYTNPGIYTVELTVVDLHGCSNSVSHTVRVNPLPVANFTWIAPTCQGDSLLFTNQSYIPPGFTGYVAKWRWNFGDGTIQTIVVPNSPNVYHTYTGSSTTYNVTLTVWSSDSCTTPVTKTVTLVAAPLANFSFSSTNCAGQPISFTNESQTNGGGLITSYLWDFGDPASGMNNTSALTNPSHNYATEGSYIVTLTAFNATNCDDTVMNTVVVNQSPEANFSADTACRGSLTTFTDLSLPNAANITSYSWDFGDGTPINTQPSPTHTYLNYGTYLVTLTIINSNGCMHTVSKNVMVYPLPIPEFSYSIPNCLGAPVDFTNQSSTVPGFIDNIVTWVWDFGDGTTTPPINFPANPNISHTFAGTALSHSVTLTITTANGCTEFIEHVVTSVPSPLANFTFPGTACEGTLVPFTDLSQPNGGGSIVQWAWNFDDPASGVNNNSNAQNPAHSFSGAGTYSVRLIVANSNGCMDTTIIPVTVGALPVSNFTADTACLGYMTNFVDASSGGTITSWFWQFGDGQTGTLANPTHLYANPATYTVTLTVTTAAGCAKDTTKQVIVYPALTASFSANSQACAGDSIQFTDLSNSPHGSITDWTWDFGDGTPPVTVTFPANPNVSHMYANGGTYPVTLTVTNSDGCTDDDVNQVTINYTPLANFSAATGGCANKGLQFTDLSQQNGGGAIISWLWDFGDPTSGISNTSILQNPTHAFTAGGTFDVNLIVTNINGCIDSLTNTITINDAPVADFTADTACFDLPTNFTDASTTGSGTIISWLWNFDDPPSGSSNTSTLQNPSHTFTNIGNYDVVLTVTNSDGCEHDTTFPITVYPVPDAMFQYSAACMGSPTVFTDLSIAPGSTIISWYWDFGDGTGTATIQNPTYTYAAAGTYNVQLTITNLHNCTDSVVMPIIVRNNPTANFSYMNFYCPAGQVNFQDISIGAGSTIIDRIWIFEPGYTATGPNPIHTFTQTNTTYAVTLIVTDNYGCMDTIIDSVFVKPGFAFTYSNDTVCFGYPTHFHPENLATGDSLYSVAWNFGDPASVPNNTSFLYNPTHVFSAPGTYVVKLKAWNSDNCKDSVYQEVTVYDLPEPAFSFVSEPCNSNVDFADLSTGGGTSIASWEWIFGDGTSQTIVTAPGNTTHLYPDPDTYNVTLIITNSNGCVDSITQTVVRYECISASFTTTSLMCARNPILFADNSFPITSITQWQWIFGDGMDTTYSSFTDTIAHEYTNAGNYVVKLVINALVSGVSFTDSSYQIISIRPTPEAYFSNRSVCFNQSTLFIDTSYMFGDPNTSWYWNFGEPTSGVLDTSTFENPLHKYMNTGYYDVQMIVENQWGCIDSIRKTTRVFDLPIADFESTAPCQGDPTIFTDFSTPTDTTFGIWRWNFGVPGTKKDTSNLQDPSYTYDSLGTYTVRMIVQDLNGCRDTIDSTCTVNVTPLSSFNITEYIDGMNGKLQMENLSTGDDNSYYWNFGNGKYSDEENPVISYTEDGTYIIELISLNKFGCSDTTFFQYELLFKGLYIPNAFAPSSSNLAVRLFKPVGINLKRYHIQVFNTSGHVMWESTKIDPQGRPLEGWDGSFEGKPMLQGNYMWKVSATFIDDSPWNGSDIGTGEYDTMGTVTLIR